MENSIFCPHCGTSLPESQAICTACGCPVTHIVRVTIQRKSLSLGRSSKIKIELYGSGIKETFSLANGVANELSLPTGEYYCCLSGGRCADDFRLVITKDTCFEVSFETGLWLASITLREIC
ncbi:MAG: zinc ribbon domain-containing protein [Clostridia bacterium]|nr:zinc ribbon domain-containing protein [Clostridia bacterium]